MQEKEIRKLHRENYKVPEGEKTLVHYKRENVLNDPKTGRRESQQVLCKTGATLFESVKRNLELQGNTIEILYHPDGKYSNVVIPVSPEEEMEAKNAEIEALKAQIAKMEAEKKEPKSPKAKKEVK